MYKKVCEEISLNLFIYYVMSIDFQAAMAMASILGHSLSPFTCPYVVLVYSYMYMYIYTGIRVQIMYKLSSSKSETRCLLILNQAC